MKKHLLYTLKFLSIISIFACLSDCSLDEYNPSGFTVETVASSSVEGFTTIINNCYFGWEQRFAGNQYYAMMSEGGTDLWTYLKNDDSYTDYFKYWAGNAPNINRFKDQWNAGYDGIGYCNLAINLASSVPFNTEEEKNQLLAEAHFLRAVYYFMLVEQFGYLTLITEPTSEVNLQPDKTDPLTIYETVIIPDLMFAAEWLPRVSEITRPCKKSALGYLAKVYLQTVEYDETHSYVQDAFNTAKLLIDDCEAGGTNYDVHLYNAFEDVFDESNNRNNMESLWSHRFVEGGTPRNAWETNEYIKLFNAQIDDFGARESDYLSWGGISSGGRFMPSHYLLKLFVQEDGSLDPRYNKSFTSTWFCNVSYTWTDVDLTIWDRSAAVSVTDSLSPSVGDTAAIIVHPNDESYDNWVAVKRDKKYLVVDLADVYNDTVKMQYTRVADGVTSSNVWRSFFPSLSKHNSSDTYLARTDKPGYIGNNNALFVMRMAEIYLIAAEADIYLGGSNALTYINRIRGRAGANLLSGAPTIQTILDERARELCGEFHRWHDLKRTGNLNKAYLSERNYDVGQYFVDGVYQVRPIPTDFLDHIKDGGAYYQNPGY